MLGELHRRIFLAAAAEDADQQVGGDQRDFIEQEEGEQAARTRIAGDNSYSPSLSAGFPPSGSIMHNDFRTAGQLF